MKQGLRRYHNISHFEQWNAVIIYVECAQFIRIHLTLIKMYFFYLNELELQWLVN